MNAHFANASKVSGAEFARSLGLRIQTPAEKHAEWDAQVEWYVERILSGCSFSEFGNPYVIEANRRIAVREASECRSDPLRGLEPMLKETGMSKDHGRSGADAPSRHSPKGGAAKASPAKPSVPNAIAICEQFIKQVLIRRDVREEVATTGTWNRLSLTPVASIDRVEGVVPGEFAADIDSAGDGWVRIHKPNSEPLTVHYRVGMAETMDGVPFPLSEGIKRLERHLAEAPNDEPPAAVAALWRPYRRLRLS